MEMEENHSDVTQRVLHFTFELISMLTGQVFTSLKSGNMITVMAPSHSFVIPERPDMGKLLDITNKIIDLLSGEDVTVYLSMEQQQQHLEGPKKLYKMEDQPMESSIKMNPPERSPHPNNCQDSAQEEQEMPRAAEGIGIGKNERRKEFKSEVKEEETEIAVTVKEEDSPSESSTDWGGNRTSPDGHHILPSGCKTEKGNIEEDSKEKTPITPEIFPYVAVIHPSSDSSAPAEVVSDKPVPVTEHSQCPIDTWFACSVCGLCFSQKEALAVHERVHMYRRICPYPEENKSSEQSPVPNDQQRPQTTESPECGQNFPQKDELTDHKLPHSRDKRFKCSKCDKSYVAKFNLISHERSHTGEKPFQCLECGKRFTQKASLSEHERLHRGEKPFKCPECGNCFSRKAHLKEHQRTHTGERPYCCGQCGKYFMQKSAFTKHQQLYCGHKYPVQCLDCGRCFTQNSYLILHQRTHTSSKTKGASPDS